MRSVILMLVLALSSVAADTKDAEINFLKAQVQELTLRLQIEQQFPLLIQAKATVIQAQAELQAAKKAEAPKPETATPKAP